MRRAEANGIVSNASGWDSLGRVRQENRLLVSGSGRHGAQGRKRKRKHVSQGGAVSGHQPGRGPWPRREERSLGCNVRRGAGTSENNILAAYKHETACPSAFSQNSRQQLHHGDVRLPQREATGPISSPFSPSTKGPHCRRVRPKYRPLRREILLYVNGCSGSCESEQPFVPRQTFKDRLQCSEHHST